MPDKKTIAVKAQRKILHNQLRRLATGVVALVARIEAAERRYGLPAAPYREMLGAIEEYHNSLADEFDDMPGEPPMQSYEEAMRKVREINREACTNPLAPLLQAEANVPPQGRGDEEPAEADSPRALLEDAIAQIETAKRLSEDPDSSDADLQTHIESALTLLHELGDAMDDWKEAG